MSSVRSSPWWFAALSLAERAQLARASARNGSIGTAPALPARAVERWRKQRPFDRAEVFARRLRLDALTESEFETLAVAPHDVVRGEAPSWVTTVEHATAVAVDIERLRQSEPVGPPDGLEIARAFVEPFVTVAMSRLFARARAIVQTSPNAPFDAENATRLFEASLWGQLVSRAMKVAILELNVARVEGTLSGETPEARCADFARQLRAGPTRDRVIMEYPVLARSLVRAAEYWEQAAAEFLEDLAADEPLLRDAFFDGERLGTLAAVVSGAGDGHRHGRSVIIAQLSSGRRIVYKPRPLDVDLHFAELTDWLNARGMSPPLRAVRTISVDGHGWSEFVANTPCASLDELGRFYERFGAYLAVLHALEATDFHYENVIASGEHPSLIDLEALFHPRADADRGSDEPEWLGWRALQHSVLRAGVLPFRIQSSEESTSIDLSAVGGRGGQLSPNRFPVLVEAGTDAMRFAREHVRLPETQNRPTLGDEAIDPLRYAGHVASGFTAAYMLLVRHRDELIAPDGPLHRFADAPIRVVLRPTRQYALILSESHHPDVLRDAVERDRLIDRLWVAIPARPDLERVIAFEHADLVNGDVPLFTSRPCSRDLFTTHGNVIDGFFQRSGLESAIERIASMGEEDLLRQQWVVEASLVALVPGRHGESDSNSLETAAIQWPAASTQSRTRSAVCPGAPPDECLDAARLVANRLVKLALRDREQTCWLGLTLARDRDWVIQPIGPDLYGGTLGVALFLAYADEIMAHEPSREVARAVVAQVVRRIEASMESLAGDADLPVGALGAFGTFGGAAYVLAHIGALWNDRAMIETADRIVVALAPHVARDRHLDVINGVAGFAMAAAALHHVFPAGGAVSAVRAAAESLARAAVMTPNGAAWTTSLASTNPLTGISHGASGMALALGTAGTLLRSRELVDLAADAMRYERHTFDASRANWPDYRVLDAANVPTLPSFMWAWCHGAPGIGLARLALLPANASDHVRADLEHALRSTDAAGFGSNDSLCHGDLGNLELFVRARELGHRGAWERTLATESARLVPRLRQGHWRCGIPGGVETPGLMMGLAGIGYGLLRLGATNRVPSVLSLERPRSAICPRSDR
jgi:type 2 lantibiotic biosynthesis protein LanM